MPNQTVLCPGGANSQSGTAVSERYLGVTIASCGKIPDVPPLLDTNEGPYVIPVWNSHEGEVKAAEYVWNHIEQAKIKLSDAWAKRIEFWFLKRSGTTTSHGKIGSVVVAATQCSGFLKQQGAKLEPYALTTVAFDAYKQGAALDGVLVAPGQGVDDAAFRVVSKQTANPNNFTSFVRFVPSRAFAADDTSVNSWITGVTMRPFDVTLRDAEQSFFEQLLGTVKDLKDFPKLVFVLKRTAKVGLLFEGTRLYAADLLDAEEMENSEIAIFENAGATAKLYTEELQSLFKKEFPALNQDDFILHRGVNTCLFACPPLGLYTHGYQVETVEPVVRFFISKLFQLWDDGVKCTPAQIRFFKRHKKAWQDKGSEFMQFKLIGATDA
jgi:prephenate dehydratase